MSIEQRRHDNERIKASRRVNANVNPNPRSIGKRLHTAAPCSCWMCGNPRKFFGEITIQEKRLFQEVE